MIGAEKSRAADSENVEEPGAGTLAMQVVTQAGELLSLEIERLKQEARTLGGMLLRTLLMLSLAIVFMAIGLSRLADAAVVALTPVFRGDQGLALLTVGGSFLGAFVLCIFEGYRAVVHAKKELTPSPEPPRQLESTSHGSTQA